MYKARTRAEILSELIAESTLPSSKIEGTFEYDVLASNSLINGGVENIPLENEELPVLGTVTFR